MNALAYHEPPPEILLSLSSFLIALHVVAWPLHRLFSVGLLGQILVGFIWGIPLTSWLDINTQQTIAQLGYIGLILLVYEGGLTTDLHLLKQTFVPSILIAITGILLPIALSFLLIPLFEPNIDVSKLTAFSAGAALSSTSLGTTFAILSAVKLTSTKVGTVLVTAAMIDDVVGLVMVRVISSLSGTTIDAATILRPIGVSIAFLVVVFIASKVVRVILDRGMFKWCKVDIDGVGFVATGTAILGMSAAAGYAGTSILFSAYLAGVSASYLGKGNALQCYLRYYAPIANGLLVPFFFASIGFAIPVRQLFRGSVVWRGIVYAIVMALAKCATGCWLIILPASTKFVRKAITKNCVESQHLRSKAKEESFEPSTSAAGEKNTPLASASDAPSAECVVEQSPPSSDCNDKSNTPPPPPPPSLSPIRHKNLYPALLLGLSMTTRGEIGFLIAAIAQSSSVLAPSEVYLVVLWGILLCTLFGPIGVGVIARRIERLADGAGGRDTILGGWGEAERVDIPETERRRT